MINEGNIHILRKNS